MVKWYLFYITVLLYQLPFTLSDQDKHGITMQSQPIPGCDDAKTNLTIDWDGGSEAFTCYHPKIQWPIDETISSSTRIDPLPDGYIPLHHCMNESITYKENIPSHGDHRPVWPKFGEYLYVPPQRWLHNLEHGAIVMLYHPCANEQLVDQLRTIVTGCIRKHIITAYRLLERTRPLALVAWGAVMEMNFVEKHKVIGFIKKYALRGPEGHYPKEGYYDQLLIKLANVPSDISDSELCPNM